MSKPSEKIKAVFIVNPFSGLGHQKKIVQLLEKHLDSEKFDHQVSFTERPHHGTDICKNSVNNGADIIIAVGGDGSVNEIARPLAFTDIPLGIIPSGSGNGLARHLKIPTETIKAIKVLNNFSIKKIDTAEVNNRFFVSIAGVGFDAFVAKKFAEHKRRGFYTYAQIAIGEYFNYKPKTFTLRIDGKKVKRKALFISFANSDQFGYNTSISPHAKIDDGLIDICIMKKVPWWKTGFLAPLLFSKRIDKSKYLEIIRAEG